MTTDNFYQVIGVSRDADADQIKQAFRSKARQLHPDVSKDPDAGKKFSQLNEAYEVLSDPEKRAKYDRLGHEQYVSGRPAGYAGAQDMDFGDLGSIIDAMFGGGGARTRPGGGFGGFGAQPHARPRPPRRGQDLNIGLRVSLKDVHNAVSKQISVPAGDGYKTIDVKVPKGIKSQSKLRLRGQGMPSPSPQGQPGDLFVKIHIEPDPQFARLTDDGLDLQLQLPLSIAEATLGAKVEVPTIDGAVVMLTIPPGTASESRFRVAKHGLNGADGQGDLYVKVRIVPPSGAELTSTLREALSELKSQPRDLPTSISEGDERAP